MKIASFNKQYPRPHNIVETFILFFSVNETFYSVEERWVLHWR